MEERGINHSVCKDGKGAQEVPSRRRDETSAHISMGGKNIHVKYLEVQKKARSLLFKTII